MPELPEVEVVCQGLKPVLEGATISNIHLNRGGLRYPFPANLKNEVLNQQIQTIQRVAKYIFIHFNHGLTLVWHLGMSGRFIIEDLNQSSLRPRKHDHVILTTSNNYKITYCDPRRFGFVRLEKLHQLMKTPPFQNLGPDALNDQKLNAELFHQLLLSCRLPIKNALLNQKIIAGVGNIYASEALWQAKLSPFKLTNTFTLNEATLLLREIQEVLKRAITAGGSTLKDHAHPNGEVGYFQHSFKAYNRQDEPCHHCKTTSITKVTQSGRSTYYCKKCQQ